MARKSAVPLVTIEQVVKWTTSARDWAQKHLKLLGMIAAAGILIVGGIIAMQSWQQQRSRQASALLAAASKQLQATSRGESLVFSQETLTALQTIVDSYPHTSAAVQAHVYLGHLYFERGDYAAAQTAYGKALEFLKGNPERLLAALATMNLAYTKEANGACPEAIGDFEAVTKSPASWLHGEAYLGIGRCQEHGGDKDRAITTYERALTSPTVDDAVRRSVEERLQALRSSQRTATPADTTSPSKP